MNTSPDDVSLIIFDMDGTIIPSLEIVYSGIQRVFDEYGWRLKHNAKEINQYIGMASGELWKAIVPPDHAGKWEELRDRVRQEYPRLFREYPLLYPGVKETLAELRRRGYILVQYSNASVTYFDIVLSALGIRDYYDYTECVHENGLTKTELIARIREKYGNPGTAVVGDRIHDIDAARENGCLSVGALYGYGNDEPGNADITIEVFTELLDVFDRRIPVFQKIAETIETRKQPDKALILGINGIDCSGKTMFAEGLQNYLNARGKEAQLIHLDEFLNDRATRFSGDYRDELFYERVKQGYQYDHVKLIDNLLKPAQQDGSARAHLSLLDWTTDRHDIEREFIITPDSVVIIEGVFLFIDIISPYIDIQVFLDIPFDVCLERARTRDPEAVYRNYERKYLPAQEAYLAEYPSCAHADIIIDNTKPGNPVIT